MRRLLAQAFVTLWLLLGCGGGGGDGETGEPPAAAAMSTVLTAGMAQHVPRLPRFEGNLVAILNPGSPMAQGVTLTPDVSGPPFTYTLGGTYDGNEDGIRETTLAGRVTFAADPDVEWSGLTGQMAVDIAIPVVGHVYHADVIFSITSAERRLSGTGTFTNPLNGNTTTMVVASATPLVIKPATGAADAMSNACGFSLDGQMAFEVAGPTGTLRSTWHFMPSSASVSVRGRSFTDPAGQTTALADTVVDAPCGGNGALADWTGTFDQQWVCLPRESGQARLTLAVTAADTVTISDEDPPGSPPSTYTATMIGGNPHALRGFFIAGPVGSRYREDFNWTMRRSLSGFAQSSSYVYTEGPLQGRGGLCVGSAPRQ